HGEWRARKNYVPHQTGWTDCAPEAAACHNGPYSGYGLFPPFSGCHPPAAGSWENGVVMPVPSAPRDEALQPAGRGYTGASVREIYAPPALLPLFHPST